MKHAIQILAATSALLANGCFAAGICRPADTSALVTMNVAAPEMRTVESAVDTCLSAQELIDRARAEAARVVPAAAASSSGAYKPKTKDDNTPWRFDMNQNGKRMTADEFAAWMKAKGINVAPGKPAGSAAAAAAAAPTAAPEDDKKKKK
jgi:hypothetical protein